MDTVSKQSFEKALDKIRELSKQNAELLGALKKIAYGSYYYADNIPAEFERRRQIATETIRKASQ